MSTSAETKNKSLYTGGVVALFGSGEKTPSGRRIFESVFKLLPDSPKVAILETPAGFELNSAQVAESIANYLRHHLRNYKPQIWRIEARKRGTDFSPDKIEIVNSLLEADLVFMGPGSPTYAVRQLSGCIAWEYLIARHRIGAALAFSSAAIIAAGAFALPIYEIYKVGEDIHWKKGLDLFAAYSLSLVFVPHWNNTEGGKDLDTSRCFMGKARFKHLLEMLPETFRVVGIDEQTGLIIDFKNECCRVIGTGEVTLLRSGSETKFSESQVFSIYELGDFRVLDPEEYISPSVWEKALSTEHASQEVESIPQKVIIIVDLREAARVAKNWEEADKLRVKIETMGWQVIDTPDGPEFIRNN